MTFYGEIDGSIYIELLLRRLTLNIFCKLLLPVFLILTIASCTDSREIDIDPLEAFGLLGQWEKIPYSTECKNFVPATLTFDVDDQPDDKTGLYLRVDSSSQSGNFEVIPDTKMIAFIRTNGVTFVHFSFEDDGHLLLDYNIAGMQDTQKIERFRSL